MKKLKKGHSAMTPEQSRLVHIKARRMQYLNNLAKRKERETLRDEKAKRMKAYE